MSNFNSVSVVMIFSINNGKFFRKNSEEYEVVAFILVYRLLLPPALQSDVTFLAPYHLVLLISSSQSGEQLAKRVISLYITGFRFPRSSSERHL
jgi:hypothetical protein